jgi:hypothetical protein
MSLYIEIWNIKTDLLRNRYLELVPNINLLINFYRLVHKKVDKWVFYIKANGDLSIYRFMKNRFIYLTLKG